MTHLSKDIVKETVGRTLDGNLKLLEENDIENVRFYFSDTYGVARGKIAPTRHFRGKSCHGVYFPGLMYACDTQTNIDEKSPLLEKVLYSDVALYPYHETLVIIPWLKKTADIIIGPDVSDCDVGTVDPRSVCQQQIRELQKCNLTILSSFEYEFWLVNGATKEPITSGKNVYSLLRLSKHHDFLTEIVKNMYQVGVDVEYSTVEYAPGQYEFPCRPKFGIGAADNATIMRNGIKEMALNSGFMASFMSKPYRNEAGSSAHLNHSLWSADGETCLTGDETRTYGLSEIGEYWVAGLLHHAQAISVLMAPTINCLHRFRPGDFAPFNATWGIDNRTVAIRIKSKGFLGVYVENRMGASACNPYIALAANIAAGLDGINRKLSIPPPLSKSGNASDPDIIRDSKPLPRNMETALDYLKKDQVICSALGNDFIENFVSLKEAELSLRESEKNIEDDYEWARRLLFEYI